MRPPAWRATDQERLPVEWEVALAAGLGAGGGDLEAAGGAAGDPDAAQQVQGRLRMGVDRIRLRVRPRDLLTGLVVREAGTGHSRPGLTAR
jgi:hypothetical protein